MYLAPRGRALEGIIAAVGRVPSPQSVYLYYLSLDGTLRAIRELPDRPIVSEDAAWTPGVRESLDRALRNDAAVRPDYLSQSDRAKATYAALKRIGERLAAFPGRKAVVWVSHGIPAYARDVNGSDDFEPVLESFAAAFGQAEIAVYSVAQSAEATASGMMDRWTLKPLSSLTGGRWYPGDRIEEAVLQAVADSRVSYRVVYRQPAGKADATWWQYRPSNSASGSAAGSRSRKIRLVCARAGVRLLSRPGYYMPAPARRPAP